MTIHLDPDTKRLIEQEVKAGRFRRPAPSRFPRGDLEYTREEIDAMLAKAVESLERGEGVDGEEFFVDLERQTFPASDPAAPRPVTPPRCRLTATTGRCKKP